MTRLREELERMKKVFSEGRLKDIEGAVEDQFGVEVSASYLDLELKNPLVVAPGPLSQETSQIERAAKAGYGGMVLKSVVGEDENGNTSMEALRTKPTFARWVTDAEGNPIYHWNGGLDLRKLEEYVKFAEKAFELGKKMGFPLIASCLCHLPKEREEEWRTEEWEYTAARLAEAASILYGDQPIILEIDFCPFLKREKLGVDKEVVLRWYRELPKLIKTVSANIRVVPKILNLDFGSDFQTEMVKASKEGKADGVVIANRFFRKYLDDKTKRVYFTAHGGKELREMNQCQIREAHQVVDLPISATGGTYSGKHVREYLALNAQNVQLLTYVMKNGFEKAFQDLVFNPKTGLIVSMLKEPISR